MGAPGTPRAGGREGGGDAGRRGRDGRLGGTAAVPSHTLVHGIGRRGLYRGRGTVSFHSCFCSFLFNIPWGVSTFSWDSPGRRATGSLQRAATARTAHIAALRRARAGITIEIRWCPAHKGIAGSEKADEWAKEAAGQPGSHGLLPRSLANLKREISEKKWVEARRWAGGRTSKTKYRMPERQKPDGAVAGSTKRLASRYY